MIKLFWIIACFLLGVFGSQYFINRRNHKKIRPISRRERKLIKKLLKFVEKENNFPGGLCSMIDKLQFDEKISKKEVTALLKITNNANFSPLRYGESLYSGNGAYWFEPYNKEARINHLNRLLNE